MASPLAGPRGLPGRALRGLLAAAALLLGARAEAEAPEVLWYVADFPPSSIQSGPLKGQGYLDRIVEQVLWPALPGFRHRWVVAPPSRFSEDAKRNGNVCNPSMVKTPERAATYHVSHAVFRFPPSGVALRTGEQAQVDAFVMPSGELNLEKLLGESTLSLGAIGTRRYGAAVDHAIAQHPDRLLVLSTTQANLTLLRMLAMHRSVDLALSYGFEIPYLVSQYPELAGQLVWMPVRGQPHSLTNHVACAKSDIGQQVVRELNRHLRSGASRDRAQALFEDWLDPRGRRTMERLRRDLGPDAFWHDSNP